ncbi:MAG TPA: hypothetical protein VFX09_04955 [Burkholderiales bacterium]|nr:hypothetical protein [Burkholderiales bacterium]
MKIFRFIFFFGMFCFLAACGDEDRDTRLYGPDAAKVAGDTAPWSNAPFHGNQLAWDHQQEKRARLQNEYTRIR